MCTIKLQNQLISCTTPFGGTFIDPKILGLVRPGKIQVPHADRSTIQQQQQQQHESFADLSAAKTHWEVASPLSSLSKSTVTLCALQWRDQLAGTFHLLHHLKRWHGFSSVSFSSLVPLALAEEPPAKFYYTLNKPAYSPVSRTHYGVSGLIGTVKHLFYHTTTAAAWHSYSTVTGHIWQDRGPGLIWNVKNL